MRKRRRSKIEEALDHGPMAQRIAAAGRVLPEIKGALAYLKAKLEARCREYAQGLERWDEWSPQTSTEPLPLPSYDPFKRSAAAWLLVSALFLFLWDLGSSGPAAYYWLSDEMRRYMWLAGGLLACATAAAGKLLWTQAVHDLRYRPAVDRLKRGAAWSGFAGLFILAAFGIARFRLDSEVAFGILLTATSIAFGVATGAALQAALVYDNVNRHVVRPYFRLLRDEFDTAALLEKAQVILEPPQPPLASAKGGAAAPQAGEARPSTTLDEREAPTPAEPVNSRVAKMPRVVAPLLLALGVGTSAWASGPDNLKYRFDRSGSCLESELRRVAQVLADPTAAYECFTAVRRVDGYQWATALDAALGPQSSFEVKPLVMPANCGSRGSGEGNFFRTVGTRQKNECEASLAPEKRRAAASLRKAVSAALARFDLSLVGRKTCLWQTLSRAASEHRGVLNIVVTDGVQEGCAEAGGTLRPGQAETVVILVPGKRDAASDTVLVDMDARAAAIRQRYPTAVVLMSDMVDASWSWIKLLPSCRGQEAAQAH